MPLEEDIQKIKSFLLNKYGSNLAAILIFGSANTGHFKEETSDIDHMIFLKKLNGLSIQKESKSLLEELHSYHFATQYFNDLNGIKDYINKRKSFSTYITIVSEDGAKTIYTTPEFEETKEYLKKHPLTKEEIQKQLKEKDEFELYGYFKEIKGFNLTKSLMAHLRRKLQIMNYFQTQELIFDYKTCLKNTDVTEKEREELEKLYSIYEKGKDLTDSDIDYYKNMAKRFSERIFQI